jgi:hypothetical protein
MLTVELFLSIVAWHKQDNEDTVKKLFLIMRILYPLVIILGTIIVIWAFGINLQGLTG